jgi:S-adenosylmethionine-diacylgycerolhomoserine-N-methlytransferase
MAADTKGRMDRMYRLQRYIYDATRKYYLLGRDTLIARVALSPGAVGLEIGCGTGRNLIALARRNPGVRWYGLDASEAMLEIARHNIARAGLSDRITVACALGEDFDASALFGIDRTFDAIFISYTLTMVPAWRSVVEHACAQLRPGGTLAVVDFWDQHGLPAWCGRLLRLWLALFKVYPQPDMPGFFSRLAGGRGGHLVTRPVWHAYAIHLIYTAPAGV